MVLTGTVMFTGYLILAEGEGQLLGIPAKLDMHVTPSTAILVESTSDFSHEHIVVDIFFETGERLAFFSRE